MTKPHEEMWAAHKDCVVMIDGWKMILLTHEEMLDGQERERAQLAAQAPAMARLLLALEWKPLGTCPSCGGLGKSIPTNPIFGAVAATGHRADCEWVTVLRAAGVLP